MSDPGGFIHRENPFADPPEARAPARRLRGRLAAPVTIWTAGNVAAPSGLTMSSILVAEGNPSSVLGLMNETTALYDAIVATGRFVVHVVDEAHRTEADVFAGLRPAPGGPFTAMEVADSDWGPILTAFPNRAFCRYLDAFEAGYQRLVKGEIERAELTDLDDPLLYFRGRYGSIEGR